MTLVLAHEETLSLIRLAQKGDEEAFEKIVTCNIALVKSIVKKYVGRGMETEDLFQIGCMGLVKAVKGYDEKFDVRFSTYAVPMIAGEIKRALRDEGTIHISRSMKDLGRRAMTCADEITKRNGKEATISEIAEELGESIYDVTESLEAMRPCISVDEPVFDDDDGVCVGDRIDSGHDTENEVLNSVLLKEILDSLSPRDRQVIVLRYFRDMTQSNVAKVLGVSQVQVSRMETRIIKGLREKFG